ncbi:DNA polymerase IV [Brevibacterium salitolerans]|uniref:DNA polymerase IV n=1 Tax=Brevibacterium salitolerans TaxID=1403566 RepID=UPI0031D5FEC4
MSRKQLARGGGDLGLLGDDDSGCVILHLDMDAFFVAVELLTRPELRGRPVVVGGRGGRGVVVSASYEAREYGVHAAMPIGRAEALCPRAVFIPPSRGLYSAYSARVFDLVAEVTEDFAQVSVDEGYLDVSSALRRLGSPAVIAAGLRERIEAETGLTASVGVASTKVVAKLASARAKPDGLLVVPQAQVDDFLRPMPVEALPGVGAATLQTLSRYGIATIGELADAERAWAGRVLGSHGLMLHDFSHGIDRRPLRHEAKDHSVSAEHTFPADVWRIEELETELLRLADTVAGRLRADGWAARGAGLKYRLGDFTTFSRSVTLPVPTDLAADLHRALRPALRSLREQHSSGVRLLGLRTHDLIPLAESGRQGSLFDPEAAAPEDGGEASAPVAGQDAERREAQLALDEVRRRFGKTALTPASLLRRSQEPE